MDIEFLVQDTFALTRPQWKLATSLDEAVKAFQLAVAQDQKLAGVDKGIDMDDATSDASSDDDNVDNDEDGDDNEDSASEVPKTCHQSCLVVAPRFECVRVR